MISYQPSYDPYHSVFRILRIFHWVGDLLEVETDQVRILDFYLLFPFFLSFVRLRPKDRNVRSLGKKYEYLRPFAEVPEPRVLFQQMKLFQITAIEAVIELGLVEREGQSRLSATSDWSSISSDLIGRTERANKDQEDLMSALTTLVTEYEFRGIDGLKHRTNLLEFRYDAV